MKYKTSQEMYNELINNDNEEIVIQWKKALEEKRKLNFISFIICICIDILIVYIMSKTLATQYSINNLFKSKI